MSGVAGRRDATSSFGPPRVWLIGAGLAGALVVIAALSLSLGAALGLSGALMQGLFRNPLADPGLVGVSAGAGLAGAAAIVLGDRLPAFAHVGASNLLPFAAFTGALVATAALYMLANRVLILIGPSKSSLMRLLSGELRPTGGAVRLSLAFGIELSRRRRSALARSVSSSGGLGAT